MTISTRVYLVALSALFCAAPVVAQSSASSALPTCTELGISRVFVMIPPGKTPEEVTAAIQTGGLTPAGGQAVLISTAQRTPILNIEQLSGRMRTTLDLLLDRQTSIDGSLSI